MKDCKPCPQAHNTCHVHYHQKFGFSIECETCGYKSGFFKTFETALMSHNKLSGLCNQNPDHIFVPSLSHQKSINKFINGGIKRGPIRNK